MAVSDHSELCLILEASKVLAIGHIHGILDSETDASARKLPYLSEEGHSQPFMSSSLARAKSLAWR